MIQLKFPFSSCLSFFCLKSVLSFLVIKIHFFFFTMNRLSHDDSVKIITLSEEGKSLRYIANRLGIHYSSVSRCIKRYRETRSHSRRPTSGRPRITNPVDDRFIKMQALRKRNSSASSIKNLIAGVRGISISESTVIRRLRESNLSSRRPVKGPLLSAEHRLKRLRFAREHQSWTLEEWKNVLFTDETRVALNSPDGRERVWRRPGERYSQCCTLETEPFGGGSIMFWGGISWETRTELVPIQGGALNALRYVETILQDHVVPFMPFIGSESLLMHDNARPHKARCVSEYLKTTNIHTIDWPARSPDLNPIEHVWDHLKRKVRSRDQPPTTLAMLKAAVLEEWDNIPQDFLQNLFTSMPRRVEAVIKARGGNTAY